MGRNVEVEIYDYNFLVSVGGADQHTGLTSAEVEADGWFPHFIEYKEDSAGRLLYLYQPQCSSVAGIRRNIDWMRAHPPPHFAKVFDRVKFLDVQTEPERVIKTLHGVTLLEALEELVEIYRQDSR